jgi:tRNA pseudouridine13 synthase
MPPDRERLLAPTRAHGDPLFAARYRVEPSDFEVTERLGFQPSGEGAHDWLWVEKTGANTEWLARQLARHADVPGRDVGFSGLKDRHAVTRQWFSVPRRDGDVDWEAVDIDGVRVLGVTRHAKKLKRGVHRANAFRIRLRDPAGRVKTASLVERYDAILALGVPNYFGPQRFGHANVDRAVELFLGRRLARAQRSMALSAARAAVFNAVLDARVGDGSWGRILPGEAANLDGSGSVFATTPDDAALQDRALCLDIHPTAPLWGRGGPAPSDGEAAALEQAVIAANPELASLAAGLERAGVNAARRACRVVPKGLAMSIEADALTLRFELPRGAYATSVLREIAALEDVGSAAQSSSSST